MRKLAALAAGTVLVLLSAAPVEASLITFTTRATFDAAAPGLPTETFEDGNVSTGGIACAAPADSSTNNTCFSPGDILPGVQVVADGPFSLTSEALHYSTGIFSTTAALFANFFDDTLALQFGAGVNAVGFDAFAAKDPAPLSVSVFGASGLLGTFALSAPPNIAGTFFGVISTDELITRITLASLDFELGPAEGVDNVSFGTADVAAPVPEPATLLLVGTGLMGAGVRRWRQKRRRTC